MPVAMVCALCHKWVDNEWLDWHQCHTDPHTNMYRSVMYSYTLVGNIYYFFVCAECCLEFGPAVIVDTILQCGANW